MPALSATWLGNFTSAPIVDSSSVLAENLAKIYLSYAKVGPSGLFSSRMVGAKFYPSCYQETRFLPQ